jgi:hypothetical protein
MALSAASDKRNRVLTFEDLCACREGSLYRTTQNKEHDNAENPKRVVTQIRDA